MKRNSGHYELGARKGYGLRVWQHICPLGNWSIRPWYFQDNDSLLLSMCAIRKIDGIDVLDFVARSVYVHA